MFSTFQETVWSLVNLFNVYVFNTNLFNVYVYNINLFNVHVFNINLYNVHVFNVNVSINIKFININLIIIKHMHGIFVC